MGSPKRAAFFTGCLKNSQGLHILIPFFKNRMGDLLDAEKTADVLAQAEDLKEKMIDILGAVKERDAMKSTQKKPPVITGGVSLAKNKTGRSGFISGGSFRRGLVCFGGREFVRRGFSSIRRKIDLVLIHMRIV